MIKLVREVPAQTYNRREVIDDAIRRAGRRKQRVAMDALARSLLVNVNVVVFDAMASGLATRANRPLRRSPEIAPLFAKTDFEIQRELLRATVYIMGDAERGRSPCTRDVGEDRAFAWPLPA